MVDCKKCIYSNDCPVQYHKSNSACLTIYKNVHDSYYIFSEDFRKELNGEETFNEVIHKMIEYLLRRAKMSTI